MNIDEKLLALIGRRLPAIFDVIPRGPQGALWDRISQVALNPQPLPPQPPPELLGAALADQVAQMAWLADRLGTGWKTMAQDLDDICPPQPRRIKLPPGWWPPIPDPVPHPNWFAELHLGFASRLAAISADHVGTSLAATLNHAVERSVAAIAQMQTR